MPNTANLKPFTKGDPRASDLGRKGVAVREANRAGRVNNAQGMRTHLDTVVTAFKRETLGSDAAAVAGLLLAKLAAGQIVVRRGDEAAALLRALVDIARLEAGEATNLTMIGHVSTSDALARVAELRERARAVLLSTAIDASATTACATALAADDVDAFGVVVSRGGGGTDAADVVVRGGVESGGAG